MSVVTFLDLPPGNVQRRRRFLDGYPAAFENGVPLAATAGMRRGSVALLSCAALLLFAGSIEPGRAQTTVRLFDLTTAHGIIGDKPFQPTRVFASDDDVVYLWYAAEGCGVGTTITSTWWYLETEPPFRLAEGAVTVTDDGNWGQFNFRLAEGRRWPIGRYRVELRIGDTVMADVIFDITARATVDHGA